MFKDNKRTLAVIKMIAGFLEKASVASFAVGVFQGSPLGTVLGGVCISCAIAIVYSTEDLK